MADRRLATVRQIAEITAIPNADALELARVDGWNVVVPKADNLKAGDLVVYLETDSFLPRWPEFQFLEKSSLRKMGALEGYRLRTIKLRGQISEGLVIPLTQEYDGQWWLKIASQDIEVTVNEGDEVTELLGIVKWEPPIPAQLAGVVKGNFPSFIPKTDQERIENFFKYFERHYSDHEWEVTLKLDGSSFTAYFNKQGEELKIGDEWAGTFGVCSRNLDLASSDTNAFWIAAKKYDLERKLRVLGRNLAIQAELMGPGVQGNRENLKELDIFVFDIFDIDRHSKLNAFEREIIVSQLGLKSVPLKATAKFAFASAADFLAYAEGPSINHPIREGLVFKSLIDPNVSFKAIAHSFKLSQKD